MKPRYEHKCGLCGWTWQSKLEHPACCGRCKRYDWKEKGGSTTDKGETNGGNDHE